MGFLVDDTSPKDLLNQELKLLNQDRFIGLFLTHSDPVTTALSI